MYINWLKIINDDGTVGYVKKWTDNIASKVGGDKGGPKVGITFGFSVTVGPGSPKAAVANKFDFICKCVE
jgi:hypothetical protein